MDEYDSSQYVPIPGVNGVSYSQRLFSEEVAIAAAMNGEPITQVRQPGYEFSNGTRFDTPSDPYAPAQ